MKSVFYGFDKLNIMEIKRTMIASRLIIEAGEQYHKRPTQLKFEELVDVVQAVVKNCFIPPVVKRSELLICGNCKCKHSNKEYDGYCSQSCFDGIQ